MDFYKKALPVTYFIGLLMAVVLLSTPQVSLAGGQSSTSPQKILSEDMAANNSPEALHKLSAKEKLVMKVVKKQQKRAARKSKRQGGGKSQIVALLLCIFLGGLGIHRFYLGYTGMGLLYMFTLGLFGIGWLIDFILLLIPNGLTPKGKTNYRGEGTKYGESQKF